MFLLSYQWYLFEMFYIIGGHLCGDVFYLSIMHWDSLQVNNVTLYNALLVFNVSVIQYWLSVVMKNKVCSYSFSK